MDVIFNGELIHKSDNDFNEKRNIFNQHLSLIETILFQDGKMPYWEFHVKRIANSLQQLAWVQPDYLISSLEEQITLLTKNKTESLKVRIQLLYFQNQLNYLIEVSDLPSSATSLKVAVALHLTKTTDALATLKTNNRVIYNEALDWAYDRGCNDALILNEYGRIIESGICNVFMEKNGVLFTPPLSEGCIAGVYRQMLLVKHIRFQEFSVEEKEISIADLRQADKLYLSNALRGLRQIDEVMI